MDSLPLVLASGSPRRRDLLLQAGVRFEIMPADIPEQRAAGETPGQFASRLATEKARNVAARFDGSPLRWVLGADTIVVLGDDVLGKPRDDDHALALLARLQGTTHSVLTAVSLVSTGSEEAYHARVESRVRMRAASPTELRAYVAVGESRDKAGAYALQGEGRRFVEQVEGSETNVIGLPMDETLALLAKTSLPGPRATGAGR